MNDNVALQSDEEPVLVPPSETPLDMRPSATGLLDGDADMSSESTAGDTPDGPSDSSSDSPSDSPESDLPSSDLESDDPAVTGVQDGD